MLPLLTLVHVYASIECQAILNFLIQLDWLLPLRLKLGDGTHVSSCTLTERSGLAIRAVCVLWNEISICILGVTFAFLLVSSYTNSPSPFHRLLLSLPSMTLSKDMPPMENFGSIFWQNQFRTKIDLPDQKKIGSLQGKVAIVTGANTGLGFEASRQLLTLGLSHLVMGVRSLERGRTAATTLQQANLSARIDVWFLDMELYDSITAFAKKCDAELPRIGYTILNAGLSRTTFSKTRSTGHETTIQVNHFGTALLTLLLLPILKSKEAKIEGPARLTIVNSLTAHLCKFPNRNARPLLTSFDDTNAVRWDAQERYGVSKLVNQFFVVRLAECINADDITINMVDPGLTKGTKLSRDASGLVRIGASLFFNICGRPLDRGAATYIYALMEVGTESHGGFLMSNRISP